jgi:type IV secretion system protein VirB8
MQTNHQSALSFISAAAEFEKSRINEIEKSNKIAWRVATVGGVIGVLGMIIPFILLPLKTVEPFVIRVDNNTGATDIVTVIKEAKNSYGETVDKYFLAQYIRFRESYDWETIQSSYDSTNLLSTTPIQNEFKKLYDKPDSPLKILKDKSRITVSVSAITFIGDVAQIRFEKAIVPVGGQTESSPGQKFIATVAYKYENIPTKEKDRLINPLGFQVTSYRIDPETILNNGAKE